MRARAREDARVVLLRDFRTAAARLGAGTLPPTACEVGHRWSAAFPLPGEGDAAAESYVDWPRRFLACGDYFATPALGRVEGAFLSGRSAARALLGHRSD